MLHLPQNLQRPMFQDSTQDEKELPGSLLRSFPGSVSLKVTVKPGFLYVLEVRLIRWVCEKQPLSERECKV